MKKILQWLSLVILLFIVGIIIIVFFNPGGYRDKLVSRAINIYLTKNIDGYQAIPKDEMVPYEDVEYNHPLIPDTQEKAIYEMGVNVASLPTEITPEMTNCFIVTLGKDRATEIANGATPSLSDFLNAKNCL
ncbi:MAG: hypothetical protein A2406_02235 [Candidatus Komeilibacteria bacterium RIFOXYC1_FULL_37_11]|uniref:Uncharacterized protein n=1 Tax=Candidatus Komeilibacteria bacterium RIFOXYC1_FULL_37_11 TaxID=1798555 RepID=A0A1G2BZN9_9BACT|nr:MAG: hypothetical protein A2406_02235 [Candidatus Komeilibacteria bacterium RIFOXYC1_FULL_37_11]OGY95524.1 MAG: hypothetical protein A2611_02390 [Candidatus Komeilibacteria bacterium RIFOXYD1_FULL_37_29]